MEEAIRNFPKQFEWDPVVENKDKWKQYTSFVYCGMGGSGLQADLLKLLRPSVDLLIHKDYGLPQFLDNRLVIAGSYSGNTEETLSAFQEASQKGFPLCAISIGGKLIELAKSAGVPFIQIPDTGIQPRMSLGFMLKALLKLVGDEELLQELSGLFSLKSQDHEKHGKDLAISLQGKIPVIYSSLKNRAVAYNWKIKFNETGKIPAFYNIFPELNHNEMNGFDVKESTRDLSSRFHFIFLKDRDDHPQIQKRMEVLGPLYEKRGLEVMTIELRGSSLAEKIFSSLLLADWTAYSTAKLYGVESEQVPMVEEFKRLIL